MRVFLAFTMILFHAILSANESDTVFSDSYKATYKLDLFRAFQGTIQISREAILKNRLTYNLSIMGTYASTRGLAKPYLKAQDFNYKDAIQNQTYKLDNVEALGYGLNIQLRKYLSKSADPLTGYYMAPELFYRYLSLTSNVMDYTTGNDREVSKGLNLGYLGYMIGYQKIIRQVVAVDSYLGGGFFLSKYKDENNLTKYRNSYQIDYTGFYLNAGILIGIAN